ncbi:MAG: sporulation integral membrane protein YtvI, partial [Anaerotignum sp.]|nr:sporulation integral membrane protein YtvI [Anaerotignum sp.]
PMWSIYEKNKQAIHDIALLLAAILVCFLFFSYLSTIFIPFIIGWLMSLLFSPLADRLQKYKVPRGISAILGILILFAILGLLGFWSGNSILHKAKDFSENLPYYMDLAEVKIQEFWKLFDSFRGKLPVELQASFLEFQNDATGMLLSLIPKGSGGALGGVSNFFIAFFVALISAYFFTKDRDLIRREYQEHLAPLLGISVNTTKAELKASVWGYIKTQFILMGFTFTITIIAMLVMHSPYPLLLSIVIAIIDSLPFFGSGFILWPGAVIHLLTGNTFLAIGYMVLYAAIQVMRQILQPKILGTQIGLHPLLTLFSMYFGFQCIGVIGLIIGPIIAVILKAFFRIRNQNKESEA